MNKPAGLAGKEGSWASSRAPCIPASPEVGEQREHSDVLESQALKDGRQGQLEGLAQGDGRVEEPGPDQQRHRFLGRGIA